MKRLLLINEASTDNLGDRIIEAGMEFLIRSEFPDSELKSLPFTYIGKVKLDKNKHNSCDFSIKSNLRRVTPRFIASAFSYLRWFLSFWLPQFYNSVRYSPDCVILAGGPIVDRYGKHLCSLMLWSLLWGVVLRRPIAAFGIDCSRGIPPIRRALFRLALKPVRPIFVRSEHARERLHQEIRVTSSQTRCPAFLSSRMASARVLERDYAIYAPCAYSVYVGLMQRAGQAVLSKDDYVRHCLTELETLRTRFSVVKLATTVGSQDGPFLKELAKSSGYSELTDCELLVPDSIDELLALLAGAIYVHSGRLHMLIPAYAMGAKCDGFPRVSKIAEFMEEVADRNIPVVAICSAIEADFTRFVAGLRK